MSFDDLGRTAAAQAAGQLGDHDGLIGQTSRDFVASIEQPVSECHLVLLQVSILDRPHRSLIFAETYNRRLWNQKRVRQSARS